MSIHFTRTSWILAYAMAALHDDFTSTESFDDALVCGRYAAEEQGIARGPLPLFWRSPQAVYEADEWEAAELELIELHDEDELAALDAEDAELMAEAEALATPLEFIDTSEIELSQAEVDAIFGATRDDVVQAFFEQQSRDALSRAFALPQFGQQQWEMDGQGWERPVVQSGNAAGGDIVGGNVYAYTPEPGEQALGYPVTGVIRDDGSIEHDSRGPGAEQRNFNRYVESQKGLAFSSGPVVDPFPTQAAPCTCPVCTRGL
jgi:hypothetical protein